MTRKALCLAVLLSVCASAAGYILINHEDASAANSAAQKTTAARRMPREKVNRQLLPNRLRWALNEMGTRLERPGKERQILTGELQRSGESLPVQLVSEFPDRLRFVVHGRGAGRTIAFDGKEAKALGSASDLKDRDLVESLVYDSADHFFISLMRGGAIKSVGSRFLSDEGTYTDIYELTDSVAGNSRQHLQTKSYHFNSDTLLLEKVRYFSEPDGAGIQVETRFSDWQTTDEQKIPTRITRLENGGVVWTLLVNSVALKSKADDGIFNTP